MEKIHAKEAEKAAVENELARLKIDTMNVEAHNMQLKQTLEACERDLRDKGQQIERATLEIRQRNDSIEKKMSIVDRLNRRWVGVCAQFLLGGLRSGALALPLVRSFCVQRRRSPSLSALLGSADCARPCLRWSGMRS